MEMGSKGNLFIILKRRKYVNSIWRVVTQIVAAPKKCKTLNSRRVYWSGQYGIDNQFYNNPKTKMTILALGHGQTDRPTDQHLNLIFSPVWINSSMSSLVSTLLLCTYLSCWRAFVEILFIFWSNFSYFALVNLDSWSRLDFRP